MTQLVEALKGLTDLPIAILSLIFGILSYKNNNKTWGLLFYLVGISAILGVIVHTFVMPLLWLNIIWSALYVLLYDCIRRFTVLLVDLTKDNNKCLKRFLIILEIPFYLVTIFLMYIVKNYDILILVLYSAVCLFLLMFYIIKFKYKNKYIFMLLFCLICPIILQFFAKSYPILVAFEHTFLFLALFIVYKISKRC